MLEHDRPVTRAWVLHPDLKSDFGRRDAGPALEEAIALAAALPNLEVVGSNVVRLPKIHAGKLFGKGKIEELKTAFKAAEVELVLIDGPVTPVQQRNLEKAWDVKLLDRTGLILEIFSDRARTSEGVLQVEMAALSYQRTRLVRAWTHLERQRGGLGFVGGPGETQIEADRRAIDDQLGRLRRQLAKVGKTRELHRASRAKVPFPVVALVGYTNAGKSTLLNALTQSEVFTEDLLFATLDATTRKIELPGGHEALLTDTVGLIKKLPHHLVVSFHATLEEVAENLTMRQLGLHQRPLYLRAGGRPSRVHHPRHRMAALACEFEVPGGVAVIELPEDAVASSVRYNGKRVMTRREADSQLAIIGLSLGAEPGTHHLEGRTRQGEPLRIAFEVRDKAYETQHITIKDKRKVNPEQRDMERITRETKQIKAALRQWTAQPEVVRDVPHCWG